jgi:uncharacterized protein (DUF1501 family)
VARLIAARADGDINHDRDAFYVRYSNYDSHSGDFLGTRLADVDAALASFAAEMKAQALWSNVTVVQVSDFGRSLSSNGDGTDHGWGGNYFVAGGAVRGGQVLGEYPRDLSLGGGLDIGRGRMIPTTSWEHTWNGVAQVRVQRAASKPNANALYATIP